MNCDKIYDELERLAGEITLLRNRILESERAATLPKMLCNLGEYVIRQSRRLTVTRSDDDIDIVAHAARGIAEATLLLHYFTSAPTASLDLLMEFVDRDFSEIKEGIVALNASTNDTRLQGPSIVHSTLAKLPRRRRPPTFGELARLFGAEPEHRSFYKLYSKFVHPSPYSVFKTQDSEITSQIRQIFLTRAAIYVREFTERMMEIINILDEPI